MLERLDESLAEDLLTEVCSAEEIIENIRALGGDPEKIGERGRAIGLEVMTRVGLRRSTQARSATISHPPGTGNQLKRTPVASPLGSVSVSQQNQSRWEDFMNKDFAFKQLLRAYRSGIISEH